MSDENADSGQRWLPGSEITESIDPETATRLDRTVLVNNRGYRMEITTADDAVRLTIEQAHQFDPESQTWSDWEEVDTATATSLKELLLIVANRAANLGSTSSLSPSELAALIRTFAR